MTRRFSTHTDSELIGYLRSRSQHREEVFREIYRRHARSVFTYAQRILNGSHQAEDVLQETFVDLLRYVQEVDNIGNLPALLFRMARNRCLNINRRTRTEYITPDDISELVQFPEESAASSLQSEEMSTHLHAALRLLSEEQREAVILQMFNGLSYQEIAEVCEVPLSTVRNRIVRAKTRLRELLESHRHFNH